MHTLKSLISHLLLHYPHQCVVLEISDLMHRHRRGLIHSHYLIVLIEHLNSTINDWGLSPVNLMHNSVVVSELVVKTDDFLINSYTTLINSRLIVLLGMSDKLFSIDIEQRLPQPSPLGEGYELVLIWMN